MVELFFCRYLVTTNLLAMKEEVVLDDQVIFLSFLSNDKRKLLFIFLNSFKSNFRKLPKSTHPFLKTQKDNTYH